MAADGAGAVFGWRVCLPFAWLSAFFMSSSTQLVHEAVRLESEVFPRHLENSSSFQWWFWGFPWGRGLENFMANPGLSFAEV